ncbi:class Ib ribonucleoside-diphosphate reductase assembly flavoprotein NrdI [Lacticaseibacillus absianus]|uniref:class Ib ribonucleoside-diphosphate reductase assembly flavoprotein NrdI n=1 Tax=Lacticaseibacillus absianus TaxID=2729623 RepID=UPI001FE86595|nr:class Ib ribonucleoside-diphosphate reductase assembly flavoprotein NrdI [Lacticaseibacillus absianus]
MMLKLFYVSISGNTRAFVQRLTRYADKAHAADAHCPRIEAVEFTPSFDARFLDQPFFAMVPTYLDGGDGINSGYREVMTLDFRDELDEADPENLLGIIGSGNRNFNAQFGLTAKHYARRFNSPVIGLYELRGNDEEADRIYTSMCNYQADFDRRGVKRALVK